MHTDPLLHQTPVPSTPPEGFLPPGADQELEEAFVEEGRELAEQERRAALETEAPDAFAFQSASQPLAISPRAHPAPVSDRDQEREGFSETIHRALRHGRAGAWIAWNRLRRKGEEANAYLRAHHADELARDVVRTITRHPVVMVGGLAAAGLGLMKLVRK